MKTRSARKDARFHHVSAAAAAALAIVGALLAPGLAQATTVLQSAPSAVNPCFGCLNYTNSVSSISSGQTFTALSTDTVLDQFTFTVTYGSGTLGLMGEIYAWNGSTTTGAALYTSTLQSHAAGDTTAYTFDTSLDLAPGDKYIAVLRVVSGSIANANGSLAQQSSGGDPGGQAYVFNSGAGTWNPTVGDFAMTANFRAPSATSPTPEPAVWALMMLGFGGAGAILRRRRMTAVATA